MRLLSFSSVSETLVVVAVSLVALNFAYNAVRRVLVRRRFERIYGCKPVASYHGRDHILGLDILHENLTAAKQSKLLETFHALFQRYGNTYGSRLALLPAIRTIEPENIKAVLATNFKDYSLGLRKESFGRLLGHGIFTSDGEHWAQSRAMIRPNMVRDQVADLAMFEDLIPDLLALIPRDGSTVDLQELFFKYTIDSATDFLFGNCVHSLKQARAGEKSEESFAEAFNASQKFVWLRFRLGPLSKIYRSKKEDEYNRICHSVVDRFVDDAVSYRDAHLAEKDVEVGDKEKVKKEKYTFLQGLARQTSDRRRIRDELMNIMLAGRDTTASLLSNLFFQLAKHPRIWAKLRNEIATTFQGRLPTYEELRNLKYLKYCLNESLRLHPVVPVNGRICVNDTYLPMGGGPDQKSPLFIPKGSMVMYNLYSMHRRKDFYGAGADEFKPERWEHLRPGWEYLPFNGGPRICPGQQYALTEAGYVTVRLAQEFTGLESRDEGPWVELNNLALASKNGVRVTLVQ